MADFLVVAGAVDRVLDRALSRARALGLGEPSTIERRDRVAAVAWPRRFSAGAQIATGPDGFLCAAGTWFHRDGLGPGDEAELLGAIRSSDARRAGRALDGFFALTWSDGHRLQVMTDLVASHHVYARTLDGATAVSSSGRLLAALAPTTPDPVGSRELIATGVIYEDRSPYADVRKLGPACAFEVRPDGVSEHTRYWACKELEPESIGSRQALQSFTEAMHAVAQRIAKHFPHPVCDLTAGWDSRILAASLRAGGASFDTTVTGPPGSPDVTLSQRVADHAGWSHHVIDPAPSPDFDAVHDAFVLCDGEMDVLEYARIAHVHAWLAPRFDVSLNGSFGEVARGYWWEILEPTPGSHGPLDGRCVAEKRYATGAATDAVRALWPDDDFDTIAHLAEVVDRIDGEVFGEPIRACRLDHTYLRMRMRSWQGRIASTTDRLWPCLSPLLDREVLEVLLQTRWSLRHRNGFARQFLTQVAPDLARLPLEYGGPATPLTPRTAWRFVPAAVPLARKVVRRLRPRSITGLSPAAAARLALWGDDRVRELLDPHRMELAKHCDADALGALLAHTREGTFRDEALFGRVMGLELALRSVGAGS